MRRVCNCLQNILNRCFSQPWQKNKTTLSQQQKFKLTGLLHMWDEGKMIIDFPLVLYFENLAVY